MKLKYWAMITGLGTIWGTSFSLNAILLREMGPLSVSLGRVLLGTIFCWSFIFLTYRKVSYPHGKTMQLLLLAIANFAAPLTLFPIAQQHIASGVAGIINGLTPMAVVLISLLWPGGERANMAKLIGVVFGFFGIVLLSLSSFQANDNSEIWALAIAMSAPICYGVALNLIRGFAGFDSTLLVAFALGFASILLLPPVLYLEGWPVIQRPETWLSLGWVGFIATGFAFIGLYWLVPRVGGTNMSTSTYIAPLTAIFLGVFLLNETFDIYHGLGMSAILCGMLVVDGRIARLFNRFRKT